MKWRQFYGLRGIIVGQKLDRVFFQGSLSYIDDVMLLHTTLFSEIMYSVFFSSFMQTSGITTVNCLSAIEKGR